MDGAIMGLAVALLAGNLIGTGCVWYRLGNIGARLSDVESGGACLRHCPTRGGAE